VRTAAEAQAAYEREREAAVERSRREAAKARAAAAVASKAAAAATGGSETASNTANRKRARRSDPESPVLSPGYGSASYSTKRQRHDSGQDAAAADYMCSLCAGVITDVLESNCCGNLFCLSCVTNYFDAFPLVSTCPMCTDVAAHRWQHEWTHSEWVQRQIDTVAPKCEHCARNVLAADRDRHKTVCQKLNHPCTKCGGKGSNCTALASGVKCSACDGTKVLPGRDWSKCFKCKGRGAFDTVLGSVANCDGCADKGAYKGTDWTQCFKCKGIGAFHTVFGGGANCDGWASKCAYKGTDWTNCFKCLGRGAFDTVLGGVAKCDGCASKGALDQKCLRCFQCHGFGATGSGICYSCNG
jgi:hypothetical protein